MNISSLNKRELIADIQLITHDDRGETEEERKAYEWDGNIELVTIKEKMMRNSLRRR